MVLKRNHHEARILVLETGGGKCFAKRGVKFFKGDFKNSSTIVLVEHFKRMCKRNHSYTSRENTSNNIITSIVNIKFVIEL